MANVINLCVLFDVGVGAMCASNVVHKVPIVVYEAISNQSENGHDHQRSQLACLH